MLPAPLYSLFQVKVDYSTLGASNQFLYRTSKSRQTNREKDNDSPNKITKAHNSTFTRVILTLKKHKSTASGPAFCQVSGGAFLKSVIKSAIFSGFGQKVRAHILITIVSKYASLHGGLEGDRTLDLRVANAALSQLSYEPIFDFQNVCFCFLHCKIFADSCVAL